MAWLKDFKNSVQCTYCGQQYNWENYDKPQDDFINNHIVCPFCHRVNVNEVDADGNIIKKIDWEGKTIKEVKFIA